MCAMAAGALFRIAGGITGGMAARKRRAEYERMMGNLPLADVGEAERNTFSDYEKYYGQAQNLSNRARADELANNLALREQALPGYGKLVSDATASVSPLLRGELPPEVLRNFARTGGASTVGMGMGGSPFGFLNTGLFGARGSLGAIQQGFGLLPTLLSTLPNVSSPTTMGLLSSIVQNPTQRLNLQMQLRQQQIGINNTLNEMPTSLDAWSQHLNESGAMLMGGGNSAWTSGMGMGGGGGANSRFGKNVDPESGVNYFGSFGGFGGSGPSAGGGY